MIALVSKCFRSRKSDGTMKHMDGQIELRDGPRRSPIDLNSDGSTSTVHLVRHRLIEAPGSQSRANKPEVGECRPEA